MTLNQKRNFNDIYLSISDTIQKGITQINDEDKKYKIYSIAGQNYSFQNINDCNTNQKSNYSDYCNCNSK